MQPLIDADFIRYFRDLSHNVKNKVINPMIMDAQISDVRPLLGDDLFYKIVATPQNYFELLDEFDFDTKDGNKSKSFGLKRVIAEFAYARYLFKNSDISTPNGLVQKQNENTQNTPIDRAKELYTDQRKTAVTYWLSVERYLTIKRDTYPTFRQNIRQTTGNKTSYLKRSSWL